MEKTISKLLLEVIENAMPEKPFTMAESLDRSYLGWHIMPRPYITITLFFEKANHANIIVRKNISDPYNETSKTTIMYLGHIPVNKQGVYDYGFLATMIENWERIG